MPDRRLGTGRGQRVTAEHPQGATWAQAVAGYLARPVAANTRRSYAATLGRVGQLLAEDEPLASISAADLATAVELVYGQASPATWNHAAATVRGLLGYAADRGWTAEDTPRRFGRLARRRRVPHDHDRALTAQRVNTLCTSQRHGLRERTLWRMLYETAGRAQEVLRLDVQDLDLTNRTARTIRKGGDLDTLHYATGTARLLPRLLAGRETGPVFLSSRPARAEALPATADTDPGTGLARLSYRQAADLFTRAAGGATLHQLRHSALTHLAEAGVPAPLLMAKSGHSSARSLARYTHPSHATIAAVTDELDPHTRRNRTNANPIR